jgi:citronellol/citronellal dehydrogenase
MPAPSISGRTAVVTGAARGIGQAVAIRLAAAGAKVVGVARTARAGSGEFSGSLDETAALLGGAERFLMVQADIGRQEDRERIIAECRQWSGGLPNILVNCAAAPRFFDRRFHEMTEEAFRAAVDVNVWAAWHMGALMVPGMQDAGGGAILNVSSRQAAPRLGPPFSPNRHGGACLYGGSKAMLDRVTTGAAQDLEPFGIVVNALSPEAAIITPHASTQTIFDPTATEPVETFAEAALMLVEPDSGITGRVAFSLSLLVAESRPVYDLYGLELVEGWQPSDIDRNRLYGGYLRSPGG